MLFFGGTDSLQPPGLKATTSGEVNCSQSFSGWNMAVDNVKSYLVDPCQMNLSDSEGLVIIGKRDLSPV